MPHSYAQHGSSSSHRLPTFLATFAAFAFKFAVLFALIPLRSQFATFPSHFSIRPRFLSHFFADHLFPTLYVIERDSGSVPKSSLLCDAVMMAAAATAADVAARQSRHRPASFSSFASLGSSSSSGHTTPGPISPRKQGGGDGGGGDGDRTGSSAT